MRGDRNRGAFEDGTAGAGPVEVVHEVQQGHLVQREAAGQLQMSERGFRKLMRRIRKRGDGGVIHGLRGKASGRRMAAGKAKRIVRLVALRQAS
jgi:hypothetical protein